MNIFLRGLIILVVIYTLVYIFIYEANYFIELTRYNRYFFRYLILISVYLTGTYHLQFDKSRWMYSLWHIIHILGILVLTFFGFYDFFISPTSYQVRVFLSQVNEFLISPLLYFAMGILSGKFKNYKSV